LKTGDADDLADNTIDDENLVFDADDDDRVFGHNEDKLSESDGGGSANDDKDAASGSHLGG
jgi:hypothetical protein